MKPASFVSWCVVLGVVGALAASPARGQSSLSVSGVAGTAYTSGGSYSDRHQPTLGWRVELAVPVARSTQIAVGGMFLGTGFNGDRVTVVAPICVSCTQPPPYLPDLSYVAATVAMRHTVDSVLGLEAEAGLGTITVDHRAHAAPSWGGGLSVAMGSHVSLVANARVIRWTVDGNTLYTYPVTFGLRLQWSYTAPHRGTRAQ